MKLLRRILLIAAVPVFWQFVFVNSTCLADVLTIHATAPGKSNAGTCEGPVLVTNLDSLFTYFEIAPKSTMIVARRDSVWRRPFGDISLAYTFPAGLYSIRSWAGKKRWDGSIVYGCDTTITKGTLTLAPWLPNVVE